MDRDEARTQIRTRQSNWRTICEVHRELFDLLDDLPEPKRTQAHDLIIDAYIMGKKMDTKLRAYKDREPQGPLEPKVAGEGRK